MNISATRTISILLALGLTACNDSDDGSTPTPTERTRDHAVAEPAEETEEAEKPEEVEEIGSPDQAEIAAETQTPRTEEPITEPLQEVVIGDSETPVVVENSEVFEAEPTDSRSKESGFDSNAWNSAIGLGGGAGGKFGGSRARAGNEEYSRFEEHGWQSPLKTPLSTFATDVDTASWTNARRFLLDAQLPPVEAVRIEEFVNFFRYPGLSALPIDRDFPVAVATEVVACPWQPAHLLLRVGMATERIDAEDLPPLNLVFLIDTSGSMRPDNKLGLVQRGLRLMVPTLRGVDRIAIVTYAGNAAVQLEPTTGDRNQEILPAIDRLTAGGSTHGSAGILTAYELAARHAGEETINRVVLCTDGDFNVGVSSEEELTALIEEQRDRGVYLTALGFGTGNFKGAKLEALADHGNGNYAYVDSITEARRVLVEDRASTLLVAAQDVKVQIEFNPSLVGRYRQIGYENRALAAEDFNDDRKDAGDLGAGHQVTALYEIIPVGVEPPAPPVDPLRYQPEAEHESEPATTDEARRNELAFVKVRAKRPGAATSERREFPVGAEPTDPSPDTRLAAGIAGFAMLLRDSSFAGQLDWDGVLRLLESIDSPDPRGDRAELERLVRAARDLVQTDPRDR